MPNDAIQVELLTGCDLESADGKAQAKRVAELFAQHVKGARQTLDIAVYDFRLADPEGQIVIDALMECAQNGVNVRVAYFEPPRREKPQMDSTGFIPSAGDPMPGPDPRFLGRLAHPRITVKPVTQADITSLANAVDTRPVAGGGHLMHSKYAICDGASPNAAVWTGSANFTTDAWSIQDNNIVIVRSQDLAGFYVTDFAELWDAGRIAGTGKNDSGRAVVGGDEVDVAFAPGEGAAIDHLIASEITGAHSQIHIASMVISSGAVLGALVDALNRGVQLIGVYDGPEMDNVVHDWTRNHGAPGTAKKALWDVVSPRLSAKRSQPYKDNGPHNFMHNKCMAVDESSVVTGSFNFSQNATRNAENVLLVQDETIANEYAQYIVGLAEKYRPA